MPSLAHHALVDLFREQPSLAPRLLARVHGLKLPRGVRYRLGDTNLDHVHPAERRADLVLELRRGSHTLLVIVLEVQRRIDRHKHLAWLEYLVSARRRGPACVLVVSTSARVAAWAAQPFDLGPGNESLRVWVLGPQQIEAVTDIDAARESPGLAFLSALVHAKREPATLRAAVACLPSLGEERAELYYNLLTEHLPPELYPDLELQMLNIADYNLPPSPLFKNLRRLANDLGPDFFLNLLKDKIKEEAHSEAQKLAQTLAQTLAQDLAQDLAQNLAQDLAQDLAQTHALAASRKTLLRLLRKAGLRLSEAQQRRVERCVDPHQLDRWTDRVLAAESAREVFAAPKKRIKRTAEQPAKKTAKRTTKQPDAAPRRARRA
ncbi:MAG: hypothetical protein IPO88_26110 [Nannocystis sp.]|uniref:hypothetical protein n=1 Tax=Nannocystis sp. TaxID=1962667 RepID=UPI0024228207|nr:hypothetical protein [Nannocystis sp.]MBK9756910.1 hypothetical protein [Nannocystis sp.]